MQLVVHSMTASVEGWSMIEPHVPTHVSVPPFRGATPEPCYGSGVLFYCRYMSTYG